MAGARRVRRSRRREEGLGAVELCLIARPRRPPRSTPYLGSAACASPASGELLATSATTRRRRAARAGRGWSVDRAGGWSARRADGPQGRGRARRRGGSARGRRPGRRRARRSCSCRRRDEVTCAAAVRPDVALMSTRWSSTAPRLRVGECSLASGLGSRRSAGCSPARSASARPGGCSRTPAHYASERRQFGRTIGSNQALRHLLADMYVRRGELVVDRALRRRGARRRPRRRRADRVGRQGLRRPRRARGRARRAAGLRRHRVHRGAPGAPLPAPDHRSRAAVRRRRPPRARARPCARPASRPPLGVAATSAVG